MSYMIKLMWDYSLINAIYAQQYSTHASLLEQQVHLHLSEHLAAF